MLLRSLEYQAMLLLASLRPMERTLPQLPLDNEYPSSRPSSPKDQSGSQNFSQRPFVVTSKRRKRQRDRH